MSKQIHVVRPETDQDEVARIVSQYNFLAVPVAPCILKNSINSSSETLICEYHCAGLILIIYLLTLLAYQQWFAGVLFSEAY